MIKKALRIFAFLYMCALPVLFSPPVFAQQFQFVLKWAITGTPVSIAVDNSGFVFVVDAGNHRIQKFDSNGNFVLQWGTQGQCQEIR